MASVYDFTLRDIEGLEKNLESYANQTLLVVNVASECGLTPQYAGLQRLYEKYKAQSFAVLAFPCNDFGSQEPGDESAIKDFCERRYQVSFPLFSKIHVLGHDKHPLYAFLTTEPTQPDGPGDIAWNFAKFIVDGKGRVVARFSPQTEPFDPELVRVLEQTLTYNSPTLKPHPE